MNESMDMQIFYVRVHVQVGDRREHAGTHVLTTKSSKSEYSLIKIYTCMPLQT